MLYVRIEIWPLGDEYKARLLGECFIANTGLGTKSTGNYRYRLLGKSKHLLGIGEIKGFPRLKKLAWDLLLLVLQDARKASSDEGTTGNKTI